MAILWRFEGSGLAMAEGLGPVWITRGAGAEKLASQRSSVALAERRGPKASAYLYIYLYRPKKLSIYLDG